MASEYLIKTINGYEDYIRRRGIDEQVLDAYALAVQTAIIEEKDILDKFLVRILCCG